MRRLLAALVLGAALPLAPAAWAQTAPPRPQRPAQAPAQATAPPAAPTARPPIAAEPLAPLPPPPVQRRVSLDELGHAGGLNFDGAGRELRFPLPVGLANGALRLNFTAELAAAFGGRHAVEVSVNGRLLGALAFAEDQRPLGFEASISAEDVARNPASLIVRLRLVSSEGQGAQAKLLPASHLAIALPASVPSLATLLAALPPRVVVLVAPGAVPAEEAAAALRIALGLAGTGRSVQIGTGAPPGPTGAGATRVWETGAVVVGAAVQGAQVRLVADVPVLLLGGSMGERSAGLLNSPWQALLGGTGLAVGAHDAAAAPSSLPFPTLPPQEAARAEWRLGFTMRDIPAGRMPSALEVALHAPPDSRANAAVTLNQVVLGAMAVPPDGQLRLALPIPPRLLAFENFLEVALHRQEGPGGPAQMLPGSQLRLAPLGPAREFRDLPPAFGEGVEVILDAPGGVLPAESLAPALWVLRRLAPPGSPIRVTLQDPTQPARPAGAFLAITTLPPEGAAPPLRFEPGMLALHEAASARLLEMGGIERVWAAQLVTAGSHSGLWLRAPAVPPALTAAPPALDRGDVGLIGPQGLALAWQANPLPPLPPSDFATPPRAPATALPDATPSLVQRWRPYVAMLVWVLGFGLIVAAFANPRREWRPARTADTTR